MCEGGGPAALLCFSGGASGLRQQQQQQQPGHTKFRAGDCMHACVCAPTPGRRVPPSPPLRIFTSSPVAQALFDQGLLLTYNFNRPEVRGGRGGGLWCLVTSTGLTPLLPQHLFRQVCE